MLEALTWLLLALAALFFSAGTLGLLRLPDTLSRIHALTKADNLGLGLAALALLLHAESWAAAAQIGLIWLLALAASAASGYLIARRCLLESQGAAGNGHNGHSGLSTLPVPASVPHSGPQAPKAAP